MRSFSFGDVFVAPEDVQTLDDGSFLNDTVIAFCFEFGAPSTRSP